MKAFWELDRVLRGEPVVNPQVPVHMPSLVVMNLVLAVVYGCCIGSLGCSVGTSRSIGKCWLLP